jgi:hypothetical protein
VAGRAGLAGRLADFATPPRSVATGWPPPIVGTATATAAPTRPAATKTVDAIFAVRARLARRPLASTSWAKPSSDGLTCEDISLLNIECTLWSI